VFSWAIGARRRIGFFVRARWRGSLLTDAIYFNSTLPFGQAVMALLRPLGPQAAADAETECTQLEVPAVTEDEATASWRRLIAQGMPALGTFVVVNVNASDLCVERRWPADRFASLVNRFGSEISPVDRYVFIGSGSETDVVAEVMLHLDPSVRSRSVDLAGRTSLSDLVVLLSRSSLVITNDSGPLHLAAALDVPSVSFFGPETPKLYGPVGDQHLVFYSGHWCSPCLSVYNAKIAMCAGENECMRRIGLDDVIARTATFCRDRLGMPRPTHPVTTEPGPAEVSPAEAAP
jgi:ADP-heptose:LPS heptosyltransferase